MQHHKPTALALSTLLVFALAGTAAADTTWTALAAYPPEVNLATKLDQQSIVVMATRADGVTIDVTKEAQLTLADPAVAKLENQILYPQVAGTTTLKVAFGGHECQLPVKVENPEAERPVSFKLDVMPILMRAGCNTGSCHGAARGKDGFMLSLFGYDPDGDYHRITREQATRRLNLALPERSLFMEKSIGAVPHSGGKRFERDSVYYNTIVEWIENGVPKDADDLPVVTGIELYPNQAVLEGEGATQQFTVRANYSDGTDRDVSHLVVFMTNNDNSATVSDNGLVTAAARGEAFITARFDNYTVGSQVLVLPKDLKYNPPQEKPVNYIDELVNNKLRKLRIEPSPVCSDEVFLRRVTIDITGLLPTPEEYHEFVNDTDPYKRSKLIDRLLERKEFSEIWAMKWSQLLMVKTSNQIAYKQMFLYSNWLTGQLADNVPLDQMVRELLSSSGGTFTEPQTNFYQVERDTLKVAENVAQVFMGIRTQCAQCHNHPFDRWTMDDYYSFAAFFSQIGRKQGEDYRETVVFNRRGGDVRNPLTNQVMKPKFLGGEEPELKGQDRREALAEWLTSPENPYFAPSVANRVWDHFFGIGIVHPVDDIRVSNPPSNPELFEALGQKLIEYDYDFKQLVRDICNSNTYQRSTERNASNMTDELNFAHGNIRRIGAESLLDCINQVTETKEKFRGLPLGARAVQVADGRTSNYFLTTFGRAPRDSVCACETSTDPTLSQALHLLNGTTIEQKIGQGGVIKEMLKAGAPPQEVIESLYIRALSRKPTAEELERLTGMLPEDEKEIEAVLSDVYWALLNSREFLFNH